MKIHLVTHEPLEDFFQLIANELSFSMSSQGYLVEVIKQTKPSLKIKSQSDKVTIFYQEKAHLFRGLCLWKARWKESFIYEEIPNFQDIGPMIDLSRNAVMTIPKLKRFLLLCGKMGLNSCLLYMEDTYEIPEYPYFGYQRGRYSQAELRELDTYASHLGIELIPAIQTLAHLTNPLKWGFSDGMRDTSDILLVDETKTYLFLEAAIRSIKACFSTSKIHIGMDEAHELGRGLYLQKHGLEDRFTIMQKHLTNVTTICQKYDLKPMMWSDMFFRIGTKTGDYYDPDVHFPEDFIKQIPEVDMVYWDYYHHNESDYTRLFLDHKKLNRPVVFAGGIWTWNGLAPNYSKTFATSKAGLAAAKKAKINTVYATLWGDDGAETPLISSLLGLQYFAEEQFTPSVDHKALNERFKLFHQLEASDFYLLNAFDEVPGVATDNPHGDNPSKLLFYQDLMYGLYEKNLQIQQINQHYQTLAKALTNVKKTTDTATMFDYYQQLAIVLNYKGELSLKLRASYHQEEQTTLQDCLPMIQELKDNIQSLHHLHRFLWFEWNKPFGFEILDLRYGALCARLDTTYWRINQYCNAEIDSLLEFETELLPFDPPFSMGESLGRNLFHGIYSASKLSDI